MNKCFAWRIVISKNDNGITGRIVELGRISAAARSLRSPKSPVIRPLVRLEQHVGAVFIERATRHLQLSDAGLLLQRHARRILEPADIAAHKLIVHGEGMATWPFCSCSGARCEGRIQPGPVAPEPDVVQTMLIGGAGIGLLPDFHAAPAIAAGLLLRVLPQYENGMVDARALYPSHRSLSAKVRVLIDALVAHLASTRWLACSNVVDRHAITNSPG